MPTIFNVHIQLEPHLTQIQLAQLKLELNENNLNDFRLFVFTSSVLYSIYCLEPSHQFPLRLLKKTRLEKQTIESNDSTNLFRCSKFECNAKNHESNVVRSLSRSFCTLRIRQVAT